MNGLYYFDSNSYHYTNTVGKDALHLQPQDKQMEHITQHLYILTLSCMTTIIILLYKTILFKSFVVFNFIFHFNNNHNEVKLEDSVEGRSQPP